jgi:hypothetical protein
MKNLPFVLILALTTSSCCDPKLQVNPWPDISFVVLDEIPEKFVFSRTRDFLPTVKQVVLLPIVENYRWNGRRHHLALADPLFVEPGRETLRKTMSTLETGDQVVRRCIVLARGYCPGTLQPVINYAGKYYGKEVWLIELAKLSDQHTTKAFQSITNELNRLSLRVGPEKTFEEALRDKTLLCTGELLSPIIRKNDFRAPIVLWNVPAGTDIAICVSSNGLKVLKAELGNEKPN